MLSSTKNLLCAAVLAATPWLAQAAPTCSYSQGLGPMAPGQTLSVGRSVVSAGSFTDCYDFSVNYNAEASGNTAEVNASFGASVSFGTIDVWGVELFRDGVSVGAFDNTPESFFFPDLEDGNYLLAVSATTTRGSGRLRVAYTGSLSTVLDSTPDTGNQVPEPASLALVLGALGAAGLGARRKRAAR
ncbi:PEP-CTERM putative exosortase interaction domain-containing protein [Burkholderiales bacterium JOSHI_001]|nr:PEP-CTERM putative exosortase interaction domain-containing protein [Burkholderiales bacterium JOSHI_001]